MVKEMMMMMNMGQEGRDHLEVGRKKMLVRR
jgi:hypothetical protein